MGRGVALLFSLAVAPFAIAGEPASPAPDESKALSFPFSYTGEGLANLSGGYRRGAIYEGLLSAGVQGDLGKLIGWKGGSFLLSGIYPHGASLTQKYVHDFNGVSSIDAYDSVRLYEVWVQQEFAEGKLSIRLGQLLADTEFFIANSAVLFLNGAFGALPLVSHNFDAPVYPVAAPGARLRWSVSDSISLQVAVFDGDVGDASTNKHGVDWHLSDEDAVLALTEIAYINKGAESGLSGIYKLGAFYHRSDTTGHCPDESSHATAGGYFIVDQQLWRKPGTQDQGLSAFLRIGAAPDERSTVPFYFDGGINFKGLLPGRDDDLAGLAFSYTKLSTNLRDEDGTALDSHHEAILEATYKIRATKWLTVLPDLQYIWNPGAREKQDNAVIAGIRFNVTF